MSLSGPVGRLANAVLDHEHVIVFSGPATGHAGAVLASVAEQVRAAGVRVLRLTAPFKGPLGLQSRIMAALGVAGSGAAGGPADLAAALHQGAGGARLVLAIEDAHAMGARSLQYLELLQRLSTTGAVSLQIILSGDPSLPGMLDAPALADLRARVSSRVELAEPEPEPEPQPEPPRQPPPPTTIGARSAPDFFSEASAWTERRGLRAPSRPGDRLARLRAAALRHPLAVGTGAAGLLIALSLWQLLAGDALRPRPAPLLVSSAQPIGPPPPPAASPPAAPPPASASEPVRKAAAELPEPRWESALSPLLAPLAAAALANPPMAAWAAAVARPPDAGVATPAIAAEPPTAGPAPATVAAAAAAPPAPEQASPPALVVLADATPLHLVLTVPGGQAALHGRASQVVAALRAAGLTVDQVDRATASAGPPLRVGYFFEQDRPSAEGVRRILAPLGADPVLQALPFSGTPPFPGTVEVVAIP